MGKFNVNFLNSLGGTNVGDDLTAVCYAEIRANKSLPRIRLAYSMHLVALVRSSKTTVFIAKIILMMLGGESKKLISLFEKDLYH